MSKKGVWDITLRNLIIYLALLIVLIGIAYFFREKIFEQISNLFNLV